jgi:hypothetical protein
VIVFLILAVFTLNQIRDSTVSLHVVGSPRQATATSGTAAPTSASAQASVAQREAAVYSALVRYEIAQLTATAQSPPGSMYFVQNQIFALAPTATATNPNRFTALSQEGPVSTAV